MGTPNKGLQPPQPYYIVLVRDDDVATPTGHWFSVSPSNPISYAESGRMATFKKLKLKNLKKKSFFYKYEVNLFAKK
jgi:hypothetical protein